MKPEFGGLVLAFPQIYNRYVHIIITAMLIKIIKKINKENDTILYIYIYVVYYTQRRPIVLILPLA